MRILNDDIRRIKQEWVALALRGKEIKERVPSTRAELLAWRQDALALFADIRVWALSVEDGLADLLELRRALDRQHAAERIGDGGVVVREWYNVKREVQEGRGVTGKLRTWVSNHADDPDWAAKLTARLDEFDGVEE